MVLKLFILCALLAVFYQDLKTRSVYWFWFPLLAVSCGLLHYKNTMVELFLATILINFSFISMLLLVVYGYSKFKLKVTLKSVLGLGDILLFIALIFSFSTISFIIIFIFALIFSLILHLITKRASINKTVPLAGYMSLFFAITYTAHWLGYIHSIYTI